MSNDGFLTEMHEDALVRYVRQVAAEMIEAGYVGVSVSCARQGGAIRFEATIGIQGKEDEEER
jgi:ribosomal 50S subunit-recycling heat shock protein